ncbi:hypothetical protein AMTR_s00059p00149210 [Amborella trichopoda]|uniref:Uncharacterized protein n=1 Tax=Amborella trichopoda TaxID=13333 RepID=U5DB24_AMBTC|nr:hypothetical protein AMTR_s00059p00149210 [Amborella trichopoda]
MESLSEKRPGLDSLIIRPLEQQGFPAQEEQQSVEEFHEVGRPEGSEVMVALKFKRVLSRLRGKVGNGAWRLDE